MMMMMMMMMRSNDVTYFVVRSSELDDIKWSRIRKFLSLRIFEDQFTSHCSCTCPRTSSPCPCPQTTSP